MLYSAVQISVIKGSVKAVLVHAASLTTSTFIWTAEYRI